MKRIKVWVEMGLQGCSRSQIIEVEDTATEDEIAHDAREVMFEMIEWGYGETEETE